jgi:hypothetical protein
VPKRGERVARPAGKDEWQLLHTSKSPDGWDELCQQARGPAGAAYDALVRTPFERSTRQHRLAGSLATATVGGKALEQWQYEVTGAGRIWYCPDLERRVIHLTLVSVGHPKKTE